MTGVADGGRPARAAPQWLRRPRGRADDGRRRFLYGDRHQWTKLATLISHLGLILFLVARR